MFTFARSGRLGLFRDSCNPGTSAISSGTAVAEPSSSPAALGTRIANRFRGEGLDVPVEEFRNWRVSRLDLEE